MIEVEIERCVAGGSGLGRLEDGMVVFVPRTAPGDRVVVEIIERRDRWARGLAVSVVRPGPERVQPECPHYIDDRCGGCQLQHVAMDRQRLTKGEIVGDALRRIGRRDCADPAVVVSPVPWRYRRKITMARGENNAIGFHPYDDPSSVFDLVDCLITEQAVMDMWTQVRAARRLLPADLKGITLCRGRDDQLHLLVNSVGEWEPQAFAEHVDSRVCVWVKTEGRALNQCSGPPTRVSPDSFEQANDGLAETIREFAVDRIGEGPGIAWDLYGGFGDTARGMAASGFKVWSVDTDAGVREWREPEDDPDITWVTGRVEQVMARLPEPNVVVVNPPRVGLAAAVTNLLDGFLERSVVSRVAYVSCDPATLARDLRRMPAGKIVDMRAYDLFPQTSHVETVVILAAQP